MLEDLIGTRGAYILDKDLNILGKVPVSELQSTIRSLKQGIHAVVFDGEIESGLVSVAEGANIHFLVGMGNKAGGANGVALLTVDDME